MPAINFPKLDELIAKFEGYGIADVPATRNNNPGNLTYGPFAQQHGATGADSQGFAQFPNLETGVTAMDDLLGRYAASNHTLGDTIADWNGHGANSNAYTDFVASGLKVSPWEKLKNILRVGQATGTSGNESTGTGSIASAVGSFFGIEWARIAAFVIGLICLGAGLMAFKPVNEIVVSTAKGAAKTAAIAT